MTDSALEALKGMAHVISRIETFPHLPEGTVMVFEVVEDIDLETHARLSMAMNELFEDSGIVVIMVPQNVLKTVRAMPLSEVLELREALDEIIQVVQDSADAEA